MESCQIYYTPSITMDFAVQIEVINTSISGKHMDKQAIMIEVQSLRPHVTVLWASLSLCTAITLIIHTNSTPHYCCAQHPAVHTHTPSK